jgi:hypothetical protein
MKFVRSYEFCCFCGCFVYHILACSLVPFFIIVYMVVSFVCFCLTFKLCIFIVMFMYFIVMYIVFCIFCFHRANWHSSATLTEVFPYFFFSCKANARV